MDRSLFDKTDDFDGDVFRNIVTLRVSEDLFDDLSGGDPELSGIAVEAEMEVRKGLQPSVPGVIHRPFHYSTAIEYPFKTEPFLSTRYGDGSYGVWYGSLEFETTIHETCFHMMKAERGVEGLDQIIVRHRAVYEVHCRAILIDLRKKVKKYPDLVANDYFFTQSVGRRVQNEGHPGLLTPSARCQGANLVAFKPGILSDPGIFCYLTYFIDPRELTIRVERGEGEVLLESKM
jgi:hypothetical protein